MSALVPSAIAAAVLLCLDAAPVSASDARCPGKPAPANSHVMTSSDYPLLSVMQNEQGKVYLDFAIQPDGSIADVKVAVSSGFTRLDGAAADIARQRWRYDPVVVNGKTISCRSLAVVDWRSHVTAERLVAQGSYTIVRMAPADYPPDALAHHEEGMTAVYALVDESGKILDARILQPSEYSDLDKASLAAVLGGKWHLTPPQIDGKPAKMSIGFAIVWSLSPSVSSATKQ